MHDSIPQGWAAWLFRVPSHRRDHVVYMGRGIDSCLAVVDVTLVFDKRMITRLNDAGRVVWEIGFDCCDADHDHLVIAAVSVPLLGAENDREKVTFGSWARGDEQAGPRSALPRHIQRGRAAFKWA